MNNWQNPDSDHTQDLIKYIDEIRNQQPVLEPATLPKWLTDLPPRHGMSVLPQEVIKKLEAESYELLCVVSRQIFKDLQKQDSRFTRYQPPINPYKRQGMRRRTAITFQTTKDILDYLQAPDTHVIL